MTYLKVLWMHEKPTFPVEFLSELDDERYEVRKLERYADGHIDFAGPNGESGTTWLGETPLPSADVIAQNPSSVVYPLTAEEFEQVWQRNVISKAA